MTATPTFDRTDLRLLALLQRDGRASNADLAAQVNLSPSACLRRIQRLEATGVVAGYAARLDPQECAVDPLEPAIQIISSIEEILPL